VFKTCMSTFQEGMWLYWTQKVIQHHWTQKVIQHHVNNGMCTVSVVFVHTTVRIHKHTHPVTL
jgi:hypothetical protein